MKKLIFITIMLLSTLASAYQEVSLYSPPLTSGKYYIIMPYSMRYYIGDEVGFTTWDKLHYDITCYITNTRYLYDENKCSKFGWNCWEYTLNCQVTESTQFEGDVKYTDLRGYRMNGTLRWTRDSAGSTDIYCYNKSGLSVVKRVNDPQYCNQ